VAESVRVTAIPEVSTRIAALMNDEVDLIMDLPPDQLGVLAESDEYAISSVAPLNVNIYQICNIPPADKVEVRQALNLAIDRELIVNELLGGYGVWSSGTQSDADPLYSGRDPIAYDPDRARTLLEEAGYSGQEIKLAFDSPNYYPLGQEWTQAIVSSWKAIGLNVTMSPIEVSQRVLITPEDGWHLFTSSSSAVVADFLQAEGYASPDGWLQTQFSTEPHPAFEVLNDTFKALEQSVDEEERRSLARAAYDFIDIDFVPAIVLFTINRLSAAKAGIEFQETRNFGIELRPGKFSVTS
jgi:peptide/nickel transport system substrate-binding protein